MADIKTKPTEWIGWRRPYGIMFYLGGAFWMAHQPGMGFWDGFIWMWYVGRWVAAHATLLNY